VSWKIDSDANCRTLFQVQGRLDNIAMNEPPRAIQDNWPVLAVSHDLGTITALSQPIITVIGFMRSPAVLLTDLSNVQQARPLYYETKYSNPVDLVDDFIANFSQAAQTAQSVDAQLTSLANNVVSGGALADMAALAVRQVVANTELTVARGTDGSWNTSDVMMFMREGDEVFKCVVISAFSSSSNHLTVGHNLSKFSMLPFPCS